MRWSPTRIFGGKGSIAGVRVGIMEMMIGAPTGRRMVRILSELGRGRMEWAWNS